MTTYALLQLGDDGQVSAYEHPCCSTPEFMSQFRSFSALLRAYREIQPVATGTDRGQFKTFEIGRFSIDVMEMPERKERKS